MELIGMMAGMNKGVSRTAVCRVSVRDRNLLYGVVAPLGASAEGVARDYPDIRDPDPEGFLSAYRRTEDEKHEG